MELKNSNVVLEIRTEFKQIISKQYDKLVKYHAKQIQKELKLRTQKETKELYGFEIKEKVKLDLREICDGLFWEKDSYLREAFVKYCNYLLELNIS